VFEPLSQDESRADWDASDFMFECEWQLRRAMRYEHDDTARERRHKTHLLELAIQAAQDAIRLLDMRGVTFRNGDRSE
jgi:hypothetical protein